jgi:hypothetical protein
MDIPIKYIKYLLFIFIFLILGLSIYLYLLPKTNKLEKGFIIWFAIIIEINLAHLYYILHFYEVNKNKKGKTGPKGEIGPRGFKGNSERCNDCAPAPPPPAFAGAINDNGKFIDAPNVLRGQCKFPFVHNYKYMDKCITADPPPDKDVNDANIYGWCPTELNELHEPIKYGYCNENESMKNKLAKEKYLMDQRAKYVNDNYGILDVDLVRGKNESEAKNKCNKDGWYIDDTDLNSGSKGANREYMYMCYKKGFGNIGVNELKLSNDKPDKSLDSAFKLIDVDINDGSEKTSKKLYLYKKKSNKDFIKELSIGNNSCDSNFTILEGPERIIEIEKPDNIYIGIKIEKIDSGMKITEIVDGSPVSGELYVGEIINRVKIGTKEHKFNDKKLSLDKEFIIDKLNKANEKIIFYVNGSRDLNIDKDDSNTLLCFSKNKVSTNSIDAAFKYKTGSLYIFRGDDYYKMTRIPIQNKLSVDDTNSISEKWFSDTNCDKHTNEPECNKEQTCIFNEDENKCNNTSFRAMFTYGFNQKTYFFRGSNVYLYDDKKMKIAPGYPKPINDVFKGVPSNIDAVFTWGKDGKTYFFKGPLYYKYNDKKKEIESGYPKQSKLRWKNMPTVIDAIFTLDFTLDSTDNHPTYVISGGDSYYIDSITDELKEENKKPLDERFGGMFEASISQSEPVSVTTSTII